MPVQIFAETADTYEQALTIEPAEQLKTIQFNVSAPNAAAFQIAMPDKSGIPRFLPYELVAQPGQGSLLGVFGIRFRSYATGKPTAVLAQGWYDNEPDLTGFQLGTTVFNTSGQSSPSSSLNTLAVNAGTISPGGTYTATSPAAGTYIVGWGCGGYSSASLGDFANITCNAAPGHSSLHGTTNGTGGAVYVPNIVLTNGQVLTFTVTGGGGGPNNVQDCWAILIQTA